MFYAVVPPCFAHFLTEAALESANTLLRCDGRIPGMDCAVACSRPRDSETMFSGPLRASFHLPRLSVPYLSGYSSLHRLCVMNLSCVICLIDYTLSLLKSTVFNDIK